MRGIPFSVMAKDIEEFFKPLTPSDIRLGYYENGRSTGDGYVEFASIDGAKQALRKDRQNIGARNVELFAESAMRLFPDASYVSIGQPARPFASGTVATTVVATMVSLLLSEHPVMAPLEPTEVLVVNPLVKLLLAPTTQTFHRTLHRSEVDVKGRSLEDLEVHREAMELQEVVMEDLMAMEVIPDGEVSFEHHE